MELFDLLSYVVIGLLIGWLSRLLIKERGIKMIPSLIFGVIGSLVAAITVFIMDISGPGFYAVVGAVGVLFIVNVFRKENEKPIFEDEEAI